MKRGSWLVLTMVLSGGAGPGRAQTETAAAVDGEPAGAPGDCLVDRAGNLPSPSPAPRS